MNPFNFSQKLAVVNASLFYNPFNNIIVNLSAINK